LNEQIKMPDIIKKEEIDLMHFPHWNVPFFYNKPFIVTIHDLLLLHYPTKDASTLGPVSYWFKNLAFKKILHHAVNKARKIIAPSEFTKRDICKTLNIPLEKIIVTYLAPMDSPVSAGTSVQKYNIAKPYALYVGVAYPHKNLEKLIRAWKIFEEKYGNNYQLVLVGKENFFYNRLINSTNYKKCKNILYTGYLNDAELAQIYSKASLYVFPSLYEGFGMPPLEAMQNGVPVMSSNSTCLPEILGNGADYFDPNDEIIMADSIHKGFTDQNLRSSLISNSKSVLSRYSWEKTARETLAIYKGNT